MRERAAAASDSCRSSVRRSWSAEAWASSCAVITACVWESAALRSQRADQLRSAAEACPASRDLSAAAVTLMLRPASRTSAALRRARRPRSAASRRRRRSWCATARAVRTAASPSSGSPAAVGVTAVRTWAAVSEGGARSSALVGSPGSTGAAPLGPLLQHAPDQRGRPGHRGRQGDRAGAQGIRLGGEVRPRAGGGHHLAVELVAHRRDPVDLRLGLGDRLDRLGDRGNVDRRQLRAGREGAPQQGQRGTGARSARERAGARGHGDHPSPRISPEGSAGAPRHRS